MKSASSASSNQTRALLLSAYHAQSHQVWADRIQSLFSDWHWQCLTLPPRHFNWRIRSNGLQWAYEEADLLAEHWDLLVATSMVDLASLRSLAPTLCSIPTVIYFHENQFAYPQNRAAPTANVEPLLVPIYSALSADRIAFNSEYNRKTFLEGARNLSKKFPEPIPESALKQLDASLVTPVPLITKRTSTDSQFGKEKELLEVIWNHRWEYDKGPELLLEVIEQTLAKTESIRFHVVGQQFRQQPNEFEKIKQLLTQWSSNTGHECGAIGFMEEEAYLALLGSGDVVLSTAHHDFQGLAMQEACLSGCSPLAPNALVYPEYLDSESLFDLSEQTSITASSIVDRLLKLHSEKQEGTQLPVPDLSHYEWPAAKQHYEKLFGDLGA